jgi:putative membrane protein
MKKQLFSLSLLLSSVVIFSCNNDGNNSSTTDTTSSTTTTTSSDANMNTDTGTSVTTGTTDTTTRTGTTANNVSDADKKFMNEAASGGMMEVEAGRLASETATSDRVKAFGNMMVQDHTNANNELKGLAAQKNVMLPDSMMAEHREHINKLKNKTGKEFDKAYMSMMVTDHNEDVNKFQVTANNAADADLKAFASKTLPVLRTHLDSAKAINSSLKK